MPKRFESDYFISFQQWNSFHYLLAKKEGTARIVASALTGIDAVTSIKIQTRDGRIIPFDALEPFSKGEQNERMDKP